MTVSPLVPTRFSLPIGDRLWGDGGWATIYDKYRGEPAFEVALAGRPEVDAAVAAARTASARPLPAHRRYEILMAAAEGIAAQRDALVQTLVIEGGKPYKASVNEVRRTVETFQWSAEEAKRIGGEAMPLDATPDGVGRYAITMRQPVGVVVAITPTNSPRTSSRTRSRRRWPRGTRSCSSPRRRPPSARCSCTGSWPTPDCPRGS